MAEKKIIVDFDLNVEDIKAANDAMAKAEATTEQYQKELNALKLEQKELNALYKIGAVDADQYAKKQTELKTKTTAVNAGMRESNKIYKQNKVVIDAAKGSNEQLRARLSLLTKQYNGLSKEQRENSKTGQQMGTTIKAITDKLKANEKAVGDNRRNVGNYQEAIEKAAGNLNIMGVNVGGVITQLKTQKDALAAMTGAQNASTAATGAGVTGLKAFRIALISTGIGALLVALGSLVAFFTQTKRGAELLDQGLAGVKATFAVLVDRASSLGEGLIEMFNNPKQALKDLGELIRSQIVNRFTAIPAMLGAAGKAFQALANRDMEALKQAGIDAAQAVVQLNTGLDPAQQKRIADGLKGVAKEIGNEAAAAVDLEKKMHALKDAERALKVEVSQRRAEVAKLQLVAEDETKTFKERGEAIQKANEIQAGQLEKELDLQRQRVAIVEQQLALGENLEEDENRLAEERAKLGEIEAANLKKLRSLKAKENSIRNQEHAQTLKRENDARKLTEDQIKEEERAAEKRAEIREKFRVEQLSDIEKRKEDAINKAAELRAAGVDEAEVEAFTSQQLIEIDRAEKDARLQETLQFYEDEAEAARVKVRTEIDDAYTRKAALMLIDQELLEAKQQAYDLEANQYQASVDGLAIIDEERHAQLLEDKAVVDAQLVELDREKTDALKAHIDEVDAKQRQMQQDSIGAVQGGLGAIGGMMQGIGDIMQENIRHTEEQAKAAGKTDEQIREQTKAAKKEAHGLAVAAAIVQTLQAGIAAYQSGASVPIVGVALGPIMAAAALAFGFAQVAQMKSTKFAKGGVLKGASHDQGGIPISVDGVGGYEAEGNEIVLTKGVYNNPALFAQADRLNQLGGGAPLEGGTHFASGGVLQSTGSIKNASEQSLSSARMEVAIQRAVSNLPAPEVNVNKINRMNSKINEVQIKQAL